MRLPAISVVSAARCSVLTLGAAFPVAAHAQVSTFFNSPPNAYNWQFEGPPLFTTATSFSPNLSPAAQIPTASSGFRFTRQFAAGSGTVLADSLSSFGGQSAIASGNTVNIGVPPTIPVTIARLYSPGSFVTAADPFAASIAPSWVRGPSPHTPLLGQNPILGFRVGSGSAARFAWARLNWDGLSYQPITWSFEAQPGAPIFVPGAPAPGQPRAFAPAPNSLYNWTAEQLPLFPGAPGTSPQWFDATLPSPQSGASSPSAIKQSFQSVATSSSPVDLNWVANPGVQIATIPLPGSFAGFVRPGPSQSSPQNYFPPMQLALGSAVGPGPLWASSVTVGWTNGFQAFRRAYSYFDTSAGPPVPVAASLPDSFYIALRFTIASRTHYGWAKVQWNPGNAGGRGAYSIARWGFNNEPDSPSLISPCPADYNADDLVNTDDLSDFLTAYYASPLIPGDGLTPCPGAPVPYNTLGYAADFNRDCAVNTDDISDFITAYFTAPCG